VIPDKDILEKCYSVYNRKDAIPPDPLETVYNYKTARDQEIAGFIAAVFAYGRVTQILSSLADLSKRTGDLYEFVTKVSEKEKITRLKGWKHRFADGKDCARLFMGLSRILEMHGSLENTFCDGFKPEDTTVYPALCVFYQKLARAGGLAGNHILPDPAKGSACKRFHLFLRWMVRKDNVDPGVWKTIPASRLIVPLDVHMHRVCRELGATARKQADLAAALEATEFFRRISPEDPVKYDFCLTRAGIWGNNQRADFAVV